MRAAFSWKALSSIVPERSGSSCCAAPGRPQRRSCSIHLTPPALQRDPPCDGHTYSYRGALQTPRVRGVALRSAAQAAGVDDLQVGAGDAPQVVQVVVVPVRVGGA